LPRPIEANRQAVSRASGTRLEGLSNVTKTQAVGAGKKEK
jgi:hypothetical protein